ncbi:MAG TPA: hypothetical protein VJ866_05350 [Pyrinomonadaceae bacterium]|nr:hypothetical protein [Pyrinomonadaceae bacterium]
MRRRLFPLAVLIVLACAGAAAAQQQTAAQKEAARVATREKLRALLAASGPKRGIEIAFRQSDKQPFNFVAVKRGGFANAEGFEVVVGVSNDETIGFRIYPYYKGDYVNINKARDSAGLMKKLLNLSDHNFLFWGADDTGDVFAGYTFTLESGFPDKAIEVVLYSIAPLDQYVGQMRPFIDGSAAALRRDASQPARSGRR